MKCFVSSDQASSFWQVLLLKYRNGSRGLQKTMTDVPLEHHEECSCVCKDDWDWPPTDVIAVTRVTQDVINEPLPLLQRSASHPLPPGANRIHLFTCCPFANWIKQNRLESNRSPEWIWRRGIPIVCSECIFRKTKYTGADFDYYLGALKTILFCSSELKALRHLSSPLLLGVFFIKVLPAWADTVMENGSFFVQVLFISVSEPASAARLPLPLHEYHQGKERCIRSSFPSPFFYHGFNLWWNTAAASPCLAIKTVLYVIYILFPSLLCIFYQRLSRRSQKLHK